MLVIMFSISLCLFILSIISSIPWAQAYHWDGIVMYDLEYQGTDFDAEAASWTSSTSLVTSGVKTSTCGSNRVLGGYNVMYGASVSWYKSYSSLPSHNTIYANVRLYMVDDWSYSSDHFHITFDNLDFSPWNIGSTYNAYASTSKWGSGSYTDLDPMMIYLTIPHTSSSLFFQLTGHYSYTTTQESIAMRDLIITFATETTVPLSSICGVSGGWPLSNNICGCGSGTIMSPANSGICTGCSTSCLTCNGVGSSACTSCSSNKYLANGVCSACHSSCLTCNGGTRTTCTSCSSPLVLAQGACCHASCASCSGTTSSNCLSCPDGRYLSSGSCYLCHTSCLTCSGSTRTMCNSCLSPLVLVSGTCCDPSCATCSGTSSTNCASCANGKYLTSSNSCSSCDSSCSTCNGAGRTACTACSSPLILIGSTCCHASCAACSGTSSTSCISCANGKYLTSSNSCSSCDSSCSTCNGAGRTACTACSSPLILIGSTCCHASCAACSGTSSTSCISCAAGKYLSGGQCLACDSSCSTCNGAGRTACVSCQSPLVLAGSTCCDASCATCSGTSSTSCTSCANGKYLTGSNSCAVCDSSCLTCNAADRTACLSCQSPLLLAGGACCDPSCATCSGTTSTTCTSCANGKYLSGGQCLACDSSCLACNAGWRTSCTSCQSPLVLISGTCCDASCATCSGTGSSNCLSCATGSYLSNGQCLACDSSCLTCNGAGRTACTSCQSSLALIGGTCCDPSCATCSGTSSTNCASCVNGKYLTGGGACSFCDSSCSTCNGGGRTACTSCQSPLVLIGGTCCDPSCATCSGPSSSHCLSCANGKYLTSSNSCSSCDSSCLTCSSGGPAGCTSCPSNQYLSATSCYSSCDSPLVQSSSGGIDYCDTPCAGQYAYLEGGCGSCPSPRKKVQKNGFDVCGTPCSDPSAYYYWNSSCLSTCPHPLDATVDATGAKFCTNPCGPTSTNYLFYNQSCLGTCPSPLSEIQDPGVQYCLSPCDSGSFLYENKTCINNCQSPFLQRLESFAQYCDRPCDPGFYWFRNASCLASCPAPYVRITWSGVLQCLPPCKDSEFFYEFEKECHPKCESPFSMKSFEVIKICYNSIPLSLSETTKVQDAAKGMESQGSMASGGMKAAGAMNSGSPSSALLAGLSSMLQYIRYMKINYPPKVQMLFLVSAGSPISLGFDFNIPESVAKRLDDNRLPDVFEKYDINSNFVNNLWDFLMTLLIVLVMIGVLSVIKFIVPEKRYPKISLILSKILGTIRWNVPIMMVCSSSGDIFFYASLQIQSSTWNSFSAIICVFVSVLMMIVVCVILLIGLKILRTWKNESTNSNWADKWSGYEILYEEYEENSIWSLSYMILFILRGIVFNLTLANLFNFPLIQCIIINISNVMMFSYLLYLRPLKNFLNLVQLFVNEGLVNIIGVSIIILAIMDKAGISGKSTRVSVGDAIYFVIKVFNTFGLVFMGIGLLVFLVFAFKAWKRLKAQKINSPMKIFKAMVLGEAVGGGVLNPFETNEVLKKARIRKPPRKHKLQTTNQTNEVIYIAETEMSRVQMVTDMSRAEMTVNDGLSNEDFTPKRNHALRQTGGFQGEDVSDLQISELDIQPSYELARERFGKREDNSPSFRGFSIEKSQIISETGQATEEKISPDKSIEIMKDRLPRNRKILKNSRKSIEPVAYLKKSEVMKKDEVKTGKIGIEVPEIIENPIKKGSGVGGFLKNLGGKIKGQSQKTSKEPSRNAEKSQVIDTETGASDIQVTEIQNDEKGDGFIQKWGRFKGHMKSRRHSNISIDQEQAMEITAKEETMEERGEIRENPQEMTKTSSVEFVQDWGRFKRRRKTKEPSNFSLNQQEKSATVEPNEKEEKAQDIEIRERTESTQEKKKNNTTGRIVRRQPKNLSASQAEKSETKKADKEGVIEKRIETGDAHNKITAIMANSQNRMKPKEPANESPPQEKKSQIKKKDKKKEVVEEKIDTGVTDLEITETPENDGFIQDWGNLKSRMKPKEPTNIHPPQGKESQLNKLNQKEVALEETAASDKERMEVTEAPQSDNKGLGFIEDWGNLQGRVSTITNSKDSSSLFIEIKKLESRLKNNSITKNSIPEKKNNEEIAE